MLSTTEMPQTGKIGKKCQKSVGRCRKESKKFNKTVGLLK
jgi:hypothetical protein